MDSDILCQTSVYDTLFASPSPVTSAGGARRGRDRSGEDPAAVRSDAEAAREESFAPSGAEDFLGLLHRFGDKLYNFAYRLSGNAQDAGDLFQEALTRAFRNRERYDPSKPFDAWVGRILYNVYLDEARRYARKHTVSLDAPPPVEDGTWTDVLPGRDPDPADEAGRRERDRLIQRALAQLPPDYRAAVALCDVEGLSYERIAEVVGCPLGTVRSRIHQGRILFRKAFDKLQNGSGGDVP